MLSMFLLIPLSLMLFVIAIWAVRYAVKSNQFEDLDNASQRIILDDRQERRQTMQAHQHSTLDQQSNDTTTTGKAHDEAADTDLDTSKSADCDHTPKT